jgi:glycosyltransferase involved in cell wall biosynthesis
MRIGFLCSIGWSIHSVYDGLTKELYKHQIDTSIINIDNHRTLFEWRQLISHYDYFMAPSGPEFLKVYKKANIPDKQLILIAHAPWEISNMVEKYGPTTFDTYAGIFCVSNRIKKLSESLGVTANVKVVQNGVIFERYCCEPSKKLTRIGYGYPINNPHGWKRSYITKMLDFTIQTPPSFLPFTIMREFYKNIDASLLFSTITEACGLINLEAAAAGRLIMSTDVGILEDYPDAPAVRLRMRDKDMVEDIYKSIEYYKNNDDKFHRKCVATQEFAREYYSWDHAVKSWLTALNSVL